MSTNKGGIDFNSTNLNLLIKRDTKGVVLPLAEQDLTVFDSLQGFQPVILDIIPAGNLAIFNELKTSV